MTNTKPNVALDGHYTMTEAAMLLEVDRRSIYNWRRCGYLKTRFNRHNSRPFLLGRDILKIFNVCN